jgi:UPF0271 protein
MKIGRETMQKTFDLNANLGEYFEGENTANDQKMFQRVTSANIACGFHAGDPVVMKSSVEFAMQNKCKVGALVGLPDLFGMELEIKRISPKKSFAQALYQIGALQAFVRSQGSELSHVKFHGALAEQAYKDSGLALALVDAVSSLDVGLAIVTPPYGALFEAATRQGMNIIREAYVDRAYNPDGSLISFFDENSAITDVALCVPRALSIALQGKVAAINGEDINIDANSISVDGDNPYGVQLLDEIRRAFSKEGIAYAAPLFDAAALSSADPLVEDGSLAIDAEEEHDLEEIAEHLKEEELGP